MGRCLAVVGQERAHFFPQGWLPSLIRVLQQDLLNAVHVTLIQNFSNQISAQLILTGTKINETQSVLVLMVFVSMAVLVA